MPTEVVTPPAPPAAPAAPPKPSAQPPIPAAQAASIAADAKAKPQVKSAPDRPSAPGQNATGETIESLMRKTAKEAFAKEGKGAIITPVETPAPAPEKKPDAPKAPEAKAEPAATPKAETPAAPEAKDRFSDIAPPDGATEVTQKGWKALKDKANAEIAAAEKKLADAQAQLDTFRKATPAETEKVAKMEADLKAAHDRLAVLDLSAHPDFTKQFVEPQKKALAEVAQLFADNAIPNAPDPAALLNLPRAEFAKKVSELAATMPAFDQTAFMTQMREAYRLKGDAQNALANANQMREQLVAKTAQQEKAAFEEVWAPFDQTVKPREMPDGADDQTRQEVDAFNAARAQLRSAAEGYIFGRQTPKDIATIGAKAAALDLIVKHQIPSMQREYAKSVQLVKELTAELTAIKSAKSPGTFTGDAPKDGGAGAPKTFGDAMRVAQEAAAAGKRLY